MFEWVDRLWARRPLRVRTRVVGHVDPTALKLKLLEGESCEETDFSGGPWDMWTAVGCRFVRCKFGGLEVGEGNFHLGGGQRKSNYIDCDFDGADLRHFMPGYARFERCSFRRVAISRCISHDAEFVSCTFSGRIKTSVFGGQSKRLAAPNEFSGNDFSEAVLEDVAFRGGIRLQDQRLPTSPEYFYVPDLKPALARLNSACLQADPPQAEVSKIMAVILANDFSSGQVDALYRPKDFARDQREELIAKSLLADVGGVSVSQL